MINLSTIYYGMGYSCPSNIWKKTCPERTKKYNREIRISMGHMQTVQYIAAITV